jgi:hypothetical protein
VDSDSTTGFLAVASTALFDFFIVVLRHFREPKRCRTDWRRGWQVGFREPHWSEEFLPRMTRILTNKRESGCLPFVFIREIRGKNGRITAGPVAAISSSSRGGVPHPAAKLSPWLGVWRVKRRKSVMAVSKIGENPYVQLSICHWSNVRCAPTGAVERRLKYNCGV